MARQTQDIYNILLPKVKTALGISDATVISATSIEGSMVYAFAFCTNILEQIFDTFKADIEYTISTQKPHTKKWYATITEAFRYGQALNDDTGDYDDTGLTDEEIVASNIVQYVAIDENEIDDLLRIKVAKQGSDDLEVLTDDELTALEAYLSVRKDAGVKLQIESLEPDNLKLALEIWVDPLLFKSDGTLLADGSSPVITAVTDYLRNLPFNGMFALSLMIDEIQKVPGVVLPQVTSAESRYGILPFVSISSFVLPDAGYLRFDDVDTDLTITYNFMSPV